MFYKSQFQLLNPQNFSTVSLQSIGPGLSSRKTRYLQAASRRDFPLCTVLYHKNSVMVDPPRVSCQGRSRLVTSRFDRFEGTSPSQILDVILVFMMRRRRTRRRTSYALDLLSTLIHHDSVFQFPSRSLASTLAILKHPVTSSQPKSKSVFGRL